MINQLLKLGNKIANMIVRGYVSLTNDDSGDYSYSQITYLGKTANAENIYPYGMNANAPVDTMVLKFNVMGLESNLACICYMQEERFKNLKPGETIFGSPTSGSYIKFLANGDIEINSKGKVIVNSVSDVNVVTQGNINNTTASYNVTSNAISFSSGSFSFGFDQSGVFSGNGKFEFGTGGAYIARLGDQVTVDGNVGTITTASTNNKSN